MITGEAIPVGKNVGDKVIGGTINQTRSFIMKATAVGSKTSLAQIIKLVQDAQVEKAPIQLYADKISAIFVPFVVIFSLIVLFTWLIITGTGLYEVPEGTTNFLFSLRFTISVVVISCPCALGLATPTAVMVGTGVGAENGILIKGGRHLETAHKINAIVFDKTGTLTLGYGSSLL